MVKFRVQDSGFRMQGAGCRVQGSRSRVQGVCLGRKLLGVFDRNDLLLLFRLAHNPRPCFMVQGLLYNERGTPVHVRRVPLYSEVSLYRGTSLMGNSAPRGPYGRPMSRAL